MSVLPEAPLLPSPPEPSGEAAAVAVLEPAEREFMTARTAFLLPERSESSGLLLLVTMVLFGLSMKQGEQSWRDVVLLVGVVLFHELGHWLGMRLFGFQDVRMFFIPFLGGAASGRNVAAVAWQEALVLLMGPLPGILVGCALLAANLVSPSPVLSSAGLLFLVLNAFNLLPLVPLDGGKLFRLLLFSRHRFLENAFTVLAGLSLAGLALALQSWALLILPGLMLLGLPRQMKVLQAAHALRASHPGLLREPAALDEPSLRTLHTAAREVVPAGATEASRLSLYVRAMRDIHQGVRLRPPSVWVSLGLGGLWGLGVGATLVGIVLAALGQR